MPPLNKRLGRRSRQHLDVRDYRTLEEHHGHESLEEGSWDWYQIIGWEEGISIHLPQAQTPFKLLEAGLFRVKFAKVVFEHVRQGLG